MTQTLSLSEFTSCPKLPYITPSKGYENRPCHFFFQVKPAPVTRDIERHIGHVMTVTMTIKRNARTVNVVLKFTMATARYLNNKNLTSQFGGIKVQ